MSIYKATLIDYGVGNIRSVTRVIESTNLSNGKRIQVELSKDPDKILNSDLIILPGVGSFNSATGQLSEFRDDLVAKVRSGVPTIGICLGMQLLFQNSEEGEGNGLGIFGGNVTKLSSSRVPHMGWNQIESVANFGLEIKWAYFAHSFACRPDDESIVAGWTTYDSDRFPSIVQEQNVLGTQFHPEKSDIAGVEMLHGFISGALS